MGQQQLLLITVGVIAVIFAIVIGISLFTVESSETNRDELVSTLNTLSSMAQEYYQKPTMLGGGNKKFKKWKIPKFYKKFEGGKIKAKVNKKGDEVTLTAIGREKGRNNRTNVEVEAKVMPKTLKIKVIN